MEPVGKFEPRIHIPQSQQFFQETEANKPGNKTQTAAENIWKCPSFIPPRARSRPRDPAPRTGLVPASAPPPRRPAPPSAPPPPPPPRRPAPPSAPPSAPPPPPPPRRPAIRPAICPAPAPAPPRPAICPAPAPAPPRPAICPAPAPAPPRPAICPTLCSPRRRETPQLLTSCRSGSCCDPAPWPMANRNP
ncbi:vegetative cell wall protein gp1-like [Carcharodon carcharias]|uniref:vegetative cell wall protein gp1-like n=1 Tax=Carcharodon carcharias TaxID=13397 RepID=UPI001B7DA5CD|nr:vegetative cell wall protein gp1-like [Carcharodon carcharias]